MNRRRGRTRRSLDLLERGSGREDSCQRGIRPGREKKEREREKEEKKKKKKENGGKKERKKKEKKAEQRRRDVWDVCRHLSVAPWLLACSLPFSFSLFSLAFSSFSSFRPRSPPPPRHRLIFCSSSPRVRPPRPALLLGPFPSLSWLSSSFWPSFLPLHSAPCLSVRLPRRRPVPSTPSRLQTPR